MKALADGIIFMLRDVSLQTITEKGTKANDTFMTIVQAAKKLGVNTYQYICDIFYVIDSPTNSRYHLWLLWINSSEKKFIEWRLRDFHSI